MKTKKAVASAALGAAVIAAIFAGTGAAYAAERPAHGDTIVLQGTGEHLNPPEPNLNPPEPN